jgi:mevalonate kinase
MTTASAPGKIILFGEHAVVYGRAAIAVPLSQVRAAALVEDGATGVRLCAPDLGRERWLHEAGAEDPFGRAVRVLAQAAGLERLPPLTITVRSSIPIAGGLGSGAAMAAAIIRALALHLGLQTLASDEQVSRLTYEVERLLHGTPSGIDNTVVAFERPVYFVRRPPENQIEPLRVGRRLHFVVADTGRASITREVVEDVRRRWEADAVRFEAIFDRCGQIAQEARSVIEIGDEPRLGALMSANQRCLEEMSVSSAELDDLVAAAIAAGALGAKLSGAGRGGNMIALAHADQIGELEMALHRAGARAVLQTTLAP